VVDLQTLTAIYSISSSAQCRLRAETSPLADLNYVYLYQSKSTQTHQSANDPIQQMHNTLTVGFQLLTEPAMKHEWSF